jgi:hypothetical protein
MTKGYTWLLIAPEQKRAAASDPQSPGVPDAEAIRLFVRGDESIRITTHNRTLSLSVFGPGRVQKVHEFTTTAALGEFLQTFEQQMLGNGWMLLDVTDRRKVVRGRIDPVDQVEESRT